MASSMLEHLAAGSLVITGKWLPYDELKRMGIFFIIIESADDFTKTLLLVLKNLDEYKEKAKINRHIILDMMDWHNIKKNWYLHYELDKY